MPLAWAHFVVNADPRSRLIVGAWCDRQYGFDYSQMRAHHGLAWFPLYLCQGDDPVGSEFKLLRIQASAPEGESASGTRPYLRDTDLRMRDTRSRRHPVDIGSCKIQSVMAAIRTLTIV